MNIIIGDCQYGKIQGILIDCVRIKGDEHMVSHLHVPDRGKLYEGKG